MQTSAHHVFTKLTIAIGIMLLLPAMVQHGLFMDGAIYSAISAHMANGNGSICAPFYHKFWPFFADHPSLGFWLTSLFHRVFGTYFWVEKFYSLSVAILSALAIRSLWRSCFPAYKQMFWLPILMWILMPKVAWSFRNNMLENTVCVWVLWGVYISRRGINEQKTYLTTAAGILTFLAFWTKGPIGLLAHALPQKIKIGIQPQRHAVMRDHRPIFGGDKRPSSCRQHAGSPRQQATDNLGCFLPKKRLAIAFKNLGNRQAGGFDDFIITIEKRHG